MEGLEELGYLGLFISSFLSATLIPLSPEAVLGLLIYKGFKLWIITHTLKLTNLNNLKKKDKVNIEIDILSKYVKRYVKKK